MSRIFTNSINSSSDGEVVGIETSVNITGDINTTGIITASSFSGDGSGLDGVIVTQKSVDITSGLFL